MARVVSESTQAMVVCDGHAASRPVIHVNREFERLTGYSHRAATGRSLSQLLRPPGGQFEWERVDAIMAGSKPWRKTLPAARQDGTVFWAELHVYPLMQDGASTHWVGVITDVTENLELHEALRQSEAQHRLLAENIKDLITVHRADGRCFFASPSSRTMLGYNPAELTGKPLRLILHHEDRAAARKVFENHFAGQSESILVHRLRRKDGSYLWAETTSKTHWPVGSQRPTEIISITRDISKRRSAEDNLRAMHNLLDAVYEAVPIGLCLLDSTGLVIQCNHAFARAYDLQPSALTGRAADTLLPALVLQRAAINQNSPCECECTDAKGLVFPAEITVVALSSGAGARRLVALTNLRERKKIEARLREANQLESLGTLAGGIAHDFNNMLAIVLAYASLLRDAACDPARVAHYADTIIDAGRRGADVVRQLQLFASTHDAEVTTIDVHAVLEQNLAEVAKSWPANIQITRSFDASSSTITADPVQFAQALNKLLDNAREAMPSGGTLIVRTSDLRQALFSPGAPSETKNYLRISVEDTGAGMDSVTRSRMFEPFFTRGKMAETAGIGLAVVYGIMRAHRGSIEVDSAPGQGTRIHLLFPRAEVEPTVTPTNPPFETAAPVADRRTILLVEDEQDIGSLWQELLPTDGWRVLWARDGSEALRLFRAHREEIALVFTDIGLPLVDGWQVADTVRKESPNMPLLIASGAFRNGDRQRGYAEPVAYLSKPYILTRVMKQIRSLVTAPDTSS